MSRIFVFGDSKSVENSEYRVSGSDTHAYDEMVMHVKFTGHNDYPAAATIVALLNKNFASPDKPRCIKMTLADIELFIADALAILSNSWLGALKKLDTFVEDFDRADNEEDLNGEDVENLEEMKEGNVDELGRN